ncbi:MAG TPA: IgGFc-binding protein, partial [Polyangia bacterium]
MFRAVMDLGGTSSAAAIVPSAVGVRATLLAAMLFLAGWSCSATVPLNSRAEDGGAREAGRPLAPRDAGPPTISLPDVGAATPDAPPPAITCGSSGLGNAGCSFYAAEPPLVTDGGGCYALMVVNPGTRPAKLNLGRAGESFAMAQVARLPRGSGPTLAYQPYNEVAGLAPGDVAIIFLAGKRPLGEMGVMTAPEATNPTTCPAGIATAVAVSTNHNPGSHVGQAFHLTSDHPVIAYDVNPYGGVRSYVTSSSLLVPSENWSANYVAVVPRQPKPVTRLDWREFAKYGRDTQTFVLVVAREDDTMVTLRAPVPIEGGGGVPVAEGGQPMRIHLKAGQFAQVMERRPLQDLSPGLSGTLISSDKPVGVIGGTPCMYVPTGTIACDAVHQQVPPLSTWGHEHAAVRYRDRLSGTNEAVPWQIVAAVNDTVLTYTPSPPTPYEPPGGLPPLPIPTRLSAGETVQFWTNEPFVVRSQDAAHPIHLAGMMTGGAFMFETRIGYPGGAGDPEFVNVVPTDQYQTDTTFFTDPTYSETSLVVVRKPGSDGRFADVKLACAAAPIARWSQVG